MKHLTSRRSLEIVTVNNSGGLQHMTKSWQWGEWDKINQYLKLRGLYVVQLGTEKETNVAKIHERFFGTVSSKLQLF